MKKLLVVSLVALFALCAAFAGVNELKGEHSKAVPFEIVMVALVALVAVPALVPANKHLKFGFQRSVYFQDPDFGPLTRAEYELVSYLRSDDARPNTLQDLRNGNLVLDSYNMSLKFAIPVSYTGTRELLNASTAFAQGRIPEEFNQGVLPSGYNIAISHVLLGYATDATATVPEGDIDFANLTDAWPAALRNSEIRFKQQGSLKKKFVAAAAGTKAASFVPNSVIGLEFQCPFILEEVKQNTIEMVTPLGISFPATPALLALEINLFGAYTRPRA